MHTVHRILLPFRDLFQLSHLHLQLSKRSPQHLSADCCPDLVVHVVHHTIPLSFLQQIINPLRPLQVALLLSPNSKSQTNRQHDGQNSLKIHSTSF